MKPHEQRVVDEKRLLDEKIVALFGFTRSRNFEDLTTVERYLLRRQHAVMTEYSKLLAERIELFTA